MTPRCKSGKEQLPHWLWRMVDSRACLGVQWLDRNQRTFKIPWVNQKNSQWNEAYSQLFVEYAKHTRKLQPGGKVDHPKCKQNFKSAVGKSRALKCLCKIKTKKYRVYRFEADCSEREDGNCQQTTRSQSCHDGLDVRMDGIGVGTEGLNDASTSQVCAELPISDQLNDGGESAADFHHDVSGVSLGDAAEMGKSGFCHEPSQGGSNLVDLDNPDENSVIKMVEILHLSKFTGISVAEDSQIQNARVDSTTGNRGGSVDLTDDSQNLIAILQAHPYDVFESGTEISTQLTNSNMSMSGCTTTVQTVSESAQLVFSQLGKLGHETILCNKPRFPNSTLDGKNNQFVESLKDSSLQGLTNSSSSMETSEEEQNHSPAETALPTSVSSSTAPETASTQPSTGASAGPQQPKLMAIQVIYSSPQRVVKKEIITSNKCKIFFGRIDNRRIQDAIERKDEGVVLIELPSVNESNFNDQSKTRIEKTLERMELGVVISYRDNDIYVTRRCQSKVFLTDGVSTSVSIPRSSMKEPDKETKAFDFAMFEESVDSYESKSGGSVGRDYFMLTMGCEILKNDPSPTRVVPIRIDVQHLKAADKRFQVLGPAAFVPDPQHSISDSFDNEVHLSNFTMSSRY